MKHNQWRALALGVILVGCARTVTGADEPPPTTRATVPATSVESEVVPVPTDPTVAAADTTLATVPDYSCAEFEELLGFERMMAVKQGGAPSDAACEAAVDRSSLALNTYDTGLVFSEQYAAAATDEVLQTDTCSDPAVLFNVFEIPIMYWGITKELDGTDVIEFEPFVTDVVQPGGTASVEFVGTPNDDPDRLCTIYIEGIVAPVGGLAAGIDAAPAPDSDLLASDDVAVWASALFEEFSPEMGIGEVVNRVEDIHSPDVGNHYRRLESGQPDPTDDSATYDVCDWTPADLGAEATGTFMWVVVAEQSSGFEGHHLGLFSRGADLRWRFLGSTAVIDETVDPNDVCAVPSALS